MQFTGERYVPSENGTIKYEHLHRYAVAQEFCLGKAVLDIASGEGYGAALLSNSAKVVFGVDIDSASIEHSKERYSNRENLDFILGSCAQIPLPDASIDVVTSFETIEHHDQHEQMMQEIRRVLKQDGLLIISSPNKLIYSDACNYQNPYHVKELYYQEFNDLLNSYFDNIWMYGQRIASSSFLTPVEEGQENKTSLNCFSGSVDRVYPKVVGLERPMYFFAICSNEKIQPLQPSIYLDAEDDLYNHLVSTLQETQSGLHHAQAELQRTQSELQQAQAKMQQMHTELQLGRDAIEYVEDSKLWKAHQAYLRMKSFLMKK